MKHLSQRVNSLQSSPIRDILAVVEQPGMISYAGGLPAAESFPPVDVGAVPKRFLQYGPSEGEPELRERVAGLVGARGLDCDPEQVLILTGSQQGLDLAAKLCIDPGDEMAVEVPTYLAALQVFSFFGARFIALGQSTIPESVKLVYVNPTFQNPTGHCYTLDERTSLAEKCSASGSVLLEDDPYHDLVFEECDRTPICSFMGDRRWIYQGSFSKSFAPGLRLGFLIASKDLIAPLTQLKQAADLHSNRVSQYLVLQMLNAPDYESRLRAVAARYKAKRDRFQTLLHQHLSNAASWNVPSGGLFFWLQLRDQLAVSTGDLLSEAVRRGVAFMPGEPFWLPGKAEGSTLRLNFSYSTDEEDGVGIAKVARLLRDYSLPAN